MKTWRTIHEPEREAWEVERADKLRIVFAGMQPGVEISNL
jgi:hypothetical protein